MNWAETFCRFMAFSVTSPPDELGDAVLVVHGSVRAAECVFEPANEGVFSVHRANRLTQQLKFINAPVCLAHDHQARGGRGDDVNPDLSPA